MLAATTAAVVGVQPQWRQVALTVSCQRLLFKACDEVSGTTTAATAVGPGKARAPLSDSNARRRRVVLRSSRLSSSSCRSTVPALAVTARSQQQQQHDKHFNKVSAGACSRCVAVLA
jgi:hypothetical protein